MPESPASDSDLTRTSRVATLPCAGEPAAGICYPPVGPDGFAVVLEVLEGRPVLWFGDCACELDDYPSAAHWVRMAATGSSRLRIELIGGRMARWWLEVGDEGGEWRAALSGGVPRVRMWRPVEVVFRYNGRLRPEKSEPGTAAPGIGSD